MDIAIIRPIRHLWKAVLVHPVLASLIQRLAGVIAYRKDNVLNGIIQSNLLQSVKPVICIHVESLAKCDVVKPLVMRFVKEGTYTILLTFSSLFVRNMLSVFF